MPDPVSEAVGEMFLTSAIIAWVAAIFFVLIVVLILAKFLLPKPLSWIVMGVSLVIAVLMAANLLGAM